MTFPKLLANLELYEDRDPDMPDLGVEWTRLTTRDDVPPLRVAEMVLDRLTTYLTNEPANLAHTRALLAVTRAWKAVEAVRDQQLGGGGAA